MWLNITYQLSEDYILSYGDAKSKYCPKVDFQISHTLESSILILQVTSKLLAELGAKTVILCQNWPLNCQNTNTLYRFWNFKSLFLKINFSLICYDIVNKFAIGLSQELNFTKFCTKIEMDLKAEVLRGLSMCWDTNIQHARPGLQGCCSWLWLHVPEVEPYTFVQEQFEL